MSEESDKPLTNNDIAAGSEDRFQALINASSDVIYSLSADWSVMRELDGRGFLKDAHEPTTDWQTDNIFPDDLGKVREAIADAIREKKIVQLEHRVLRVNRTPGWTFSRAVPILDKQGNIIEWFGTASDITEHKNAEEALRMARVFSDQQKRVYETITSATPDLMYVFGLDYRFTYANGALLSMWGNTWETAVGKSLLENGYEPWHAAMHEREIDLIVKSKQPIRGEVSFPHAILGRRVYDYILTPVLNEEGEVEAVAGTTRDVTERKQDEMRKNDFIGMVSHELKTPLTSLKAIVQVANAKLKNNDDQFLAEAMTKADAQIKRMTAMINGFLDISRLESGKIIIVKKVFDVEELTREIIEEMKLSVQSHDIRLVESGKLVEVYADRDKVNSVISNLISNVVKYSAPLTTISIACTINQYEVLVSVRDEGVGIAPQDVLKIFDRYYRVENGNTGTISGFGIGLYLSAEIVQHHGGKIWVDSEQGKGSTFYFSLPADR